VVNLIQLIVFSNWYVVNVSELNSLLNYEYTAALNGYPFNNSTGVMGYFGHQQLHQVILQMLCIKIEIVMRLDKVLKQRYIIQCG
jgi:hypothetical protein